MKFSRPAAVVAAVVLLAGGVVAADAATTTNPIKLCVKSGVVSAPTNGTCPSKATTLSLASDADVAALAQRLDDYQADVTKRLEAAEAAIAELQGEPLPVLVLTPSVAVNGEFSIHVTGTGFSERGAKVYGTTPDVAATFELGEQNSPNPDGTIDFTIDEVKCIYLPVSSFIYFVDHDPVPGPRLETVAGC
jgi:hypothetical protein